MFHVDLLFWAPLLTKDVRRQACIQHRGRLRNCGSTKHSLRLCPAPFQHVLSFLNQEPPAPMHNTNATAALSPWNGNPTMTRLITSPSVLARMPWTPLSRGLTTPTTIMTHALQVTVRSVYDIYHRAFRNGYHRCLVWTSSSITAPNSS